MAELNENPLHRSLNRPNLLLGVDRELFLTVAFLTALLIMAVQSLLSTIAGILLWIISIALLRYAAKKDPLGRKVFMRYYQLYNLYYPARSRFNKRG